MTSLKKTNIFSKIINIYILALKDINIQISATGLRILIKKYKNTGSVGKKKSLGWKTSKNVHNRFYSIFLER